MRCLVLKENETLSDIRKEEQDAESIDMDFNEYDELKEFVDLENLEEMEDLPDLEDLDDLEDLNSLVELADTSPASSENTILPEQSSVPEEDDDSDGEEQDSDVDSMLDNLLDNLDANGSLEAAAPSSDMVEETADDSEDTDILGDGMDELLNMLGGTDQPEEEPAQVFSAEADEEPAEAADSDSSPDLAQEEPEEDILSLMEEPELPEPEEQESAEKKQGVFKRLFGNVITDEIAEAELAQREAEKEAAAARAEEEARQKEEREQAKAVRAEEKAAAKAKRAEAKAARKEARAARKAEKQARAAEEEAQAELEVTGKLNKVGVSIIAVLTVMFLVTEILGTQLFSYQSTMKEAEDYLTSGKYTQAYQEILGTDVKKQDRETYNKIMTVMKVQRSLNAYESYSSMQYAPDALNALLVGLRRYDENIEEARNLDIEADMDSCRQQILNLLQEEFGLSESEAYDILSLDKEEYTDKVVALGMDKE